MNALYAKALQADEAFSAALLKQFGSSYRWNKLHKDYNAETHNAYCAKVTADADWLNFMRTNQRTIAEVTQ